MLLDEYLTLDGIIGQTDLPYLPLPNIADIVLTDKEAPHEIIPTAFCFPFLRDGRVVLTNNRRRGAEVPGGHRDPINGTLELPVVAAQREALEETGAVVETLIPVGFQRSECMGTKPEVYRYPFPHSSQQFYTGFVVELKDYVENDECLMPLILQHEDVKPLLRERGYMMYLEARRKLFG